MIMQDSIFDKPKCIKCGKRLKISRRQSRYALKNSTSGKENKYVGYCVNTKKHDGNVIKFEISYSRTTEPDAQLLVGIAAIPLPLDTISA